MLPQNALSDPSVVADFLAPDDEDSELVAYELGGIALNDPSQGRQVQVWTCWHEAGAIKVAPEGGSPVTTLVTVTGAITSLSLAFDSNMAATLAYVEDGALKLRWYNSLAEQFVIDTYAGATSGRVCADDKRPNQIAISDVVFAYVRDNVLYWRQERDRYLVEYTAGPAFGAQLRRFGMTEARRVQFELVKESG